MENNHKPRTLRAYSNYHILVLNDVIQLQNLPCTTTNSFCNCTSINLDNDSERGNFDESSL